MNFINFLAKKLRLPVDRSGNYFGADSIPTNPTVCAGDKGDLNAGVKK